MSVKLDLPPGHYLGACLAPLAPFLGRGDVTDIYVNHPQEVWVEALGGAIDRHTVPALDVAVLGRLVRQIAAWSHQGVSREHPLLAASLPDGSRIQIILPPATRGDIALAIRKHVSAGLSLDDYLANNAFGSSGATPKRKQPQQVSSALDPKDQAAMLKSAVAGRRNILVSGGTSTGKTTFLNALLQQIPKNERLITIEDTPELVLRQANSVGLLAAKSQLREADITTDDLLNAALRMRPDRIIMGELRGGEAYTFLRTVNTGHPGSMSTIHADSPEGAMNQLALLILQTGARLTWEAIVHYVRSTVDVIVQLERVAGHRRIASIWTQERT